MKKDDYVQFVGIMPKELKKVKGCIFGKIVKKVGKTKVVVKPRYRHFEVIVNIADVVKVTKKEYQGQAAKKALKKIKPEPKVKKVVPPCVAKKKAEKKSGVATAVKKAKEELPKVTPAPKPVLVKPPERKVAKPVIEKKPDIPTSPKKESKTDWLKEDPSLNHQQETEQFPTTQEPNTSSVTYVVIALLVAVCIGAYFIIF